MRALSALFSLCMLAMLPNAASAQGSDVERARAHYATGTSYFDQGRYEEAAGQFRESFQLSGRAHILLNVARCLELDGQYGTAADVLEEYLSVEAEPQDAQTIHIRVTRLRERQSAQGAEDAAEQAPVEPERPSPPPASAQPDLTLPILTLSGAAALLGAGTVLGITTLSVQSNLEERCGADRVCPEDARSDVDSGRALALVTDIFLGTGVVAAGLGTALLILALTESSEEDGVSGAAFCVPTGCGGNLQGRF